MFPFLRCKNTYNIYIYIYIYTYIHTYTHIHTYVAWASFHVYYSWFSLLLALPSKATLLLHEGSNFSLILFAFSYSILGHLYQIIVYLLCCSTRSAPGQSKAADSDLSFFLHVLRPFSASARAVLHINDVFFSH